MILWMWNAKLKVNKHKIGTMFSQNFIQIKDHQILFWLSCVVSILKNRYIYIFVPLAQSSVILIGIHTNADTGSVLQHASFGSESKCSKKYFKQISNKILGKCYGKSREIKEQHIFIWLFQLRINFRCRLLSDPQPSGRSGSRRSPNNADPNT